MSWTIDFMREWIPRMGLPSALRFRRCVLTEKNPPRTLVSLKFKKPLRGTVTLRRWGSDVATLEEVTKFEIYRTVIEHVFGLRTVIDLGANIGLTSLYLATNYPGCRIVAVEPHPETFELLQQNLRPLIQKGRAVAINAAVWFRPATLAGDETERYSGFAVQEAATGSIPAITMQEIITRSGFQHIDLVKIDIEGAERELFRDLSWLDSVGALAIEFHADTRRATCFDALMSSLGFHVVDSRPTVLAIRDV